MTVSNTLLSSKKDDVLARGFELTLATYAPETAVLLKKQKNEDQDAEVSRKWYVVETTDKHLVLFAEPVATILYTKSIAGNARCVEKTEISCQQSVQQVFG